jgi:flagellar hook protein FlgE
MMPQNRPDSAGTDCASRGCSSFQEFSMSLFGAMTTAISGLSAQSTAFGNIGDNLANTQTVGFKQVDTTFDDLITESTAQTNQSGAVVARPDYDNTGQGAITQTNNALNLAITGQGFFSVSQQSGQANGLPTFQSVQQYTREGDFKLDANGYIVNASGEYLNGWAADSAGTIDTTKLTPLRVGESGYSPVATSSATLAANLPASPSSSTPITSQMSVYDALGRSQELQMTWTQSTSAANTWSLSIAQAGSTTPLGSVDITFGSAGNPAAPEGTIASITPTSGSLTGSSFAAGQKATIGLSPDFGSGAQPITLNLGTWGGSDGLTQFAGSSFNLISSSQNGVQPGSFSSVSMNNTGQVVVNYDNGQSRVVAQVPVATFADADALRRQDGQAFSATRDSGDPKLMAAGANGAGSLVTSSVESSNVDIATEFSKLIVAQRAYSANTKMVTTADDMLQQTIDMKR